MLKTKWNIAQTYLELAQKNSVLNVTNDDIINHSDISRGTFYNNFSGQQAIQDYIQARIDTEIITPIAEQVRSVSIVGDDFHDALLKFMNVCIPSFYEHWAMIKLLNECELNHLWRVLLIRELNLFMEPLLKKNRGAIKSDQIVFGYITLIIESWLADPNPAHPYEFKRVVMNLSEHSIADLLEP